MGFVWIAVQQDMELKFKEQILYVFLVILVARLVPVVHMIHVSLAKREVIYHLEIV